MTGCRRHAFDWIALLIFAVVPAVIFWQSATSLAEQGAASGGPMENAAFYPRIVASIMTLLVILHAVRLLTGRVSGTSPAMAGPSTGRALVATALFVVYLAALPYAGFHLATPSLCFCLFWLLGMRGVPSMIGAVILWLAAAFVFEGLLNVVLPVGLFNIAIFS